MQTPREGWNLLFIWPIIAKDRRLEWNDEDSAVNEVFDKDNRWWNWKVGVIGGGGEIRFFPFMLLSGTGCSCQSILTVYCTKSPGLPHSVTHEADTCSTLLTAAAQWENRKWERHEKNKTEADYGSEKHNQKCINPNIEFYTCILQLLIVGFVDKIQAKK